MIPQLLLRNDDLLSPAIFRIWYGEIMIMDFHPGFDNIDFWFQNEFASSPPVSAHLTPRKQSLFNHSQNTHIWHLTRQTEGCRWRGCNTKSIKHLPSFCQLSLLCARVTDWRTVYMDIAKMQKTKKKPLCFNSAALSSGTTKTGVLPYIGAWITSLIQPAFWSRFNSAHMLFSSNYFSNIWIWTGIDLSFPAESLIKKSFHFLKPFPSC